MDFFTKKLRTFLQGKKLWTFLLKNYVLFYTDFFTKKLRTFLLKNYVLFYMLGVLHTVFFTMKNFLHGLFY